LIYHLKKLAVGIDSVKNLKIRQKIIFNEYNKIIHVTRNTPKKKDDLIAKGSMYWVIKRRVLVRQKIKDINLVIRNDGSKGCEIELDSELIKVIPTPMRPFQGWRYYSSEDVPSDLSLNVNNDNEEALTDELNAELIKLGLY
tara:strand:+ start:108 stop:533 length:426 start_codon:yes stop_codon:yes gene_type:complete